MSRIPNIRFGGILFQGSNLSGLGFVIEEDGIEGWQDSPDARLDETPIPGEAGSFDSPTPPSSRLAAINGYCETSSIEALQLEQGRLSRLNGLAAASPFVVEEFGATQWALARALRVKFVPFGGQRWADYKLSVWMPNPRKFGETKQFGSGVPAYHFGNFPATPVFTITGSRPTGYSITGPEGRILTVTTPVTAGQTHIFDMASGELTVNGVLIDGGVSVGDTWAIGPGANWAHTITGGTGTFETALTETSI